MTSIPKPGELWELLPNNPAVNYTFKRQSIVLIVSVNAVEEDIIEYLTPGMKKRRWLTEEFVKYYKLCQK